MRAPGKTQDLFVFVVGGPFFDFSVSLSKRVRSIVSYMLEDFFFHVCLTYVCALNFCVEASTSIL